MRDTALAQRNVKGAGELGDIVDVGRFAGNVQGCRLMRNGLSRSGLPGLLAQPIFHHAVTANTLSALASSAWPGRVSR